MTDSALDVLTKRETVVTATTAATAVPRKDAPPRFQTTERGHARLVSRPNDAMGQMLMQFLGQGATVAEIRDVFRNSLEQIRDVWRERLDQKRTTTAGDKDDRNLEALEDTYRMHSAITNETEALVMLALHDGWLRRVCETPPRSERA